MTRAEKMFLAFLSKARFWSEIVESSGLSRQQATQARDALRRRGCVITVGAHGADADPIFKCTSTGERERRKLEW